MSERPDNIKEITINKFDIVGNIQEVYYDDLLYFTNLEKLTLINLIIDNNVISILTKLSKLNTFELINCEVIDQDNFNLLDIKRLSLDNTIIDNKIFSKSFDFLKINNQLFDYYNIKVDTLDVCKAKINLNKLDYTNINTLIISKTQYENNKFKDVHLIVKDDNLDIVVGEYETV